MRRLLCSTFVVMLFLVPSARAAAVPDDRPARPQAAFEHIAEDLFGVRTGDGRTGYARLVLEDREVLHSCFTIVPRSVWTAFHVSVRLATEEGRFTCFRGRAALERAAAAKEVFTLPVAKFEPLDDGGISRLAPWRQQLSITFWDTYYGSAGGGTAGGGQCMQECNMALAAALRFCAVVPDPARELCAVGAGALYVACIANC